MLIVEEALDVHGDYIGFWTRVVASFRTVLRRNVDGKCHTDSVAQASLTDAWLLTMAQLRGLTAAAV